jgi:peptidoglycan hydrolase-like protein with peptidoglycan-binding domain
MHGCVERAVWAAIAISLYALPASAVEATGTANAPANSPEQIRKAQTELQRLDCLRGPVDGKLGNQTRQAMRKFWKSAGQPAVEVAITDELISDLADRGAGFCRPARRFFAVGGAPMRPGGAPPFMRGARPPVPATPAQAPAARQ